MTTQEGRNAGSNKSHKLNHCLYSGHEKCSSLDKSFPVWFRRCVSGRSKREKDDKVSEQEEEEAENEKSHEDDDEDDEPKEEDEEDEESNEEEEEESSGCSLSETKFDFFVTSMYDKNCLMREKKPCEYTW